MKTQTQQNNVVAIAKTFKGSTFVGTTYRNAQGELSRQLVVSGITYENLLQHDFDSLQANQNVVFSTLEKNYSFDDLESIKITKEMVEEKNDNSFDFLKYLQKRKF